MHILTIKIQSSDKEFMKEILKALSNFNNAISKVEVKTKLKENPNETKRKIVESLKKGVPIEKIITQFGLNKRQIAAYKAHLTMGRY